MNNHRMLATLPLVIVSLVLCFGQSCSVPPLPLERFAGTWTLNEAKSWPDEMQKCVVRAGANGGLEMVSGSQVTTILWMASRTIPLLPALCKFGRGGDRSSFTKRCVKGKRRFLRPGSTRFQMTAEH
jgi:hypothetical protein